MFTEIWNGCTGVVNVAAVEFINDLMDSAGVDEERILRRFPECVIVCDCVCVCV